jgi:acyl-coenzyme A synthetase/AMP-(fatty) acid ligase
LDYQNESIPEGHQSWKRLLSCGEKDWVQVEDPDNTPAAYVSTSGTSGLPKAAIIPHSYLVSQAGFQMETAAVRYKISSLIAIPPFHVFTLPVQHAFPLRKGAPAYILPRFEGKAFVDAVEKFRIAHTVVVPPILMALAKCEDGAKLRSLRRIYVGGSCATDGMQQQLYTKLSPKARIEQVYGMTEVGWATTWHDPKQESTGSVGRPLPGTTLRYVLESF